MYFITLYHTETQENNGDIIHLDIIDLPSFYDILKKSFQNVKETWINNNFTYIKDILLNMA